MMASVLCRLGLHAWRQVLLDNPPHISPNRYEACQYCGERRILIQMGAVYQPLHQDWMNVRRLYVR
jgi:DNA-directed RNA polymerase subunit RPC12/RpoP